MNCASGRISFLSVFLSLQYILFSFGQSLRALKQPKLLQIRVSSIAQCMHVLGMMQVSCRHFLADTGGSAICYKLSSAAKQNLCTCLYQLSSLHVSLHAFMLRLLQLNGWRSVHFHIIFIRRVLCWSVLNLRWFSYSSNKMLTRRFVCLTNCDSSVCVKGRSVFRSFCSHNSSMMYSHDFQKPISHFQSSRLKLKTAYRNVI